MTASAARAVLERRLLPVLAPAGVTRVPPLLVLGYVAFTFVLFLIWPINWPIYYSSDWFWLIAYVCLCLAVIWTAMLAGSRGETRVTAPLPSLTLVLAAGAAISALMLIPLSFAYSGQGPWEVLESLRDQGFAYQRLQRQLDETTGDRTLIVALRVATAPLTYVTLPLGIIHWRRLGWIGRTSVAVAVATSIVYSIMRGTDKQVADIFVVGVAALFVAAGREHALGSSAASIIARYWKPALLALIFLYFAQSLFTERREERLGDSANRNFVCANSSEICADLDNRLIAWLPQRQRFGLTFFVISVSSGYYGLKLALEKPFEPAWGVGHSPAALSVYEAITDDPEPHLRTFSYRNGEDQWPEEFYWSTLMTWIANDVGFGGAVLVLGIIGYLWGLWWREAVAGMNDPAAILFVLATIMIIYLPANNQLLAAYEGYSMLFTWIAIWLWFRVRRRLFAVMPATGHRTE